MHIGQVLKAARLDAGMTLEKLANNLGISLWTLHRVEKGSRTFNNEWLDLMPAPIRARVAQALEIECQERLESIRGSYTKIAPS